MTAKIIQLMAVGDLAMDLWRAQEAAANAKRAYHLNIEQYEAAHGHLAKLIHKDDPSHAAVREFTSAKFKALQQAKRKVYAAKIGMQKACVKMARIAASSEGVAK